MCWRSVALVFSTSDNMASNPFILEDRPSNCSILSRMALWAAAIASACDASAIRDLASVSMLKRFSSFTVTDAVGLSFAYLPDVDLQYDSS